MSWTGSERSSGVVGRGPRAANADWTAARGKSRLSVRIVMGLCPVAEITAAGRNGRLVGTEWT